MKTPHHSVSGRSYLASTPDSSNVAVFEVRLFFYKLQFILPFELSLVLQRLFVYLHDTGGLGLVKEMPYWMCFKYQQQH